MLRHIVMLTLKEEAAGDTAINNANKMVDQLHALADQIPQILAMNAHLNLLSGPNAPDLVLIADFKDQADLDIYRVHPAHQKVVAFIKEASSGRKAVDFIT